MSKSLIMPPDEILVYGNYDVAVCGAGAAGVSAAIAAARNGANVILLEQRNCAGGMASSGGLGHLSLFSAWGSSDRVVGGIAYEIAVRTAKEGFGLCTNTDAEIDTEGLKYVLDCMLEEAGVHVLFDTYISQTYVMDGKAQGVIVQNDEGRRLVYAKRIIDATGSGSVCASANCDFHDTDGTEPLPPTLIFSVGGADYDKVNAYRKGDIHLNKALSKAIDDGAELDPSVRLEAWWRSPNKPDQLVVNMIHLKSVSTEDAASKSESFMRARGQAHQLINVFRKYVDGMQGVFLNSTAQMLGMRESRRVVGEYKLSEKDLHSGVRPYDSIGWGTYFSKSFLSTGVEIERGAKYGIPYRIMLPKFVDNLFVAGQAVSTEKRVAPCLNIMSSCSLMGEASGTAAVLSLRAKVRPKEFEVSKLQEALKEQGVIL